MPYPKGKYRGKDHWNFGKIPWNKGKPMSEESKKKVSESKRGQCLAEEHKRKISRALIGRERTEESKEKMRRAQANRSIAWRNNISKSMLGHPNWNTGKTWFKPGFTPWNKDKKAPQQAGENHWNWKGGVSRGYKEGYWSSDYRKWRKDVFERDDYTCQVCGECGCYLTAHHIKSWARYPEHRFDVNNGKTLCRKCHRLEDNYRCIRQS